MTNKKSVVSKLLFLVVVLTLISCCFLGSTFARYTSGGTGSATMSVAKWNVKNTNDSISVNFSELSPNKEAYVGGDSFKGEFARAKSTAKMLAATIENKGAVDALVTLTAEGETLTNVLTDDWGSYSEEAIKGMFDVKFYTNTTENAEGATLYGEPVNVPKANGVLYIYVEVTWTSDDETVFGDTADARDTWVGENITSVGYTISYTAVQNS